MILKCNSNFRQDCAAVLSNGRRVIESVLALTAGTSAVWLGARWHAAPRRAVRTLEHSGTLFNDAGDLLIIAMTGWLAKHSDTALGFWP